MDRGGKKTPKNRVKIGFFVTFWGYPFLLGDRGNVKKVIQNGKVPKTLKIHFLHFCKIHFFNMFLNTFCYLGTVDTPKKRMKKSKKPKKHTFNTFNNLKRGVILIKLKFIKVNKKC